MMLKKIAVLGAGTMGHGIAESFAIHGYEVNLFDNDATRLAIAKEEIEAELELLALEKFIEPGVVQSILNRITLVTDLKQCVIDRDYVIEATFEEIGLKQELFKTLDELCPPHTILASNTSTLQLSEMTKYVSVERKEKVIVNHWYNPAHLMPIVELSYFGNMPDSTYGQIEKLYESIDKTTVKVLKDIPGLIANRIAQAIAREVFSLIEMGAAAPEDIDKALQAGPAFRYATTGHLEIADLGGLDIWYTSVNNILKDIESTTEPSKLLKEKVNEGKLGIKTGEGFYKYEAEEVLLTKERFNKRLINQLKAMKKMAEIR
ncbi:3-hydroxyacyl-CoA dehydrogenase family protein [Sporosarcina sp. YIM B06819]|uniref:3-hydroxyacyl-CoA dehydrogenase family protein n=1 Tax=Sporosarcina sp. YIM B06819 TaxID=3081769 RepID=UPI00298BF0A9|nr:3-hydroxyacyl-CoA dehydrogenase NAD-binding domain-containing protein [Sporosarcina sp. YIM B06819]